MKSNSLIFWDGQKVLFVSNKDLGKFGCHRDTDKSNWKIVGITNRITTTGKIIYRKMKAVHGDSVEALENACSISPCLMSQVQLYTVINPYSVTYKSYYEETTGNSATS